MGIAKYGCAEPSTPEPYVPEELIHRLWEQLGFPRDQLQTTNGKQIHVQHPGHLQTDAGPDFTGARLAIDHLTWHGAVEIHRYSSDWYKHGHQDDRRYNSVVLHVTLYSDTQTGRLEREDGTVLPEIVLAPFLTKPIWQFIRTEDSSSRQLPCEHIWPGVEHEVQQEWLAQLGEERLKHRTTDLTDEEANSTEIERWLYRRLFRALGYSKNADEMERLAEVVPIDLARTLHSPVNLEALYMGAAGLLPPPSEASKGDTAAIHYLYNARNSFRGLQIENNLSQLEKTVWTFFRLRPANFPTLRIAQASALLGPGGVLRDDPIAKLRSDLKTTDPLAAIRIRLKATPSSFWTNHVQFGKTTDDYDPSLGSSRTDKLIENAVAPAMLVDAIQRENMNQRRASIALLQNLPPSNDSIVRKFKKMGVDIANGLITQGIHHLYRTRCAKSRCFDCRIGRRVLKPQP